MGKFKDLFSFYFFKHYGTIGRNNSSAPPPIKFAEYNEKFLERIEMLLDKEKS